MSMFKKIMDWNEATKAKNKAAAEARTARMNERMDSVSAKLKAVDDKNKARLDAASADLKKSREDFKELCASAKVSLKEFKESAEYQEAKAKSDKQSSVAWKIIKWGLLLMLAGPLLMLLAVMIGVAV